MGTPTAKLNEETIGSLLEIARDGDPTLVTDLIRLYRENTPLRLEEIRKGLNSQDAKLVAYASHTLKSSSGTLGASQLQDLCKQIEMAAKANDLTTIPALFAKVESEVPAVLAALAELEIKAKSP